MIYTNQRIRDTFLIENSFYNKDIFAAAWQFSLISMSFKNIFQPVLAYLI